MIELTKVKAQLSKIGYKTTLWQRAEVKELCNVLHKDEVVYQAANGYYEGGFSLMVATDQRLLLVDRKPMFLTLDSIAYSMIQEISYNYRLLNSTLHIFTTNKCLDFSSWHHSQIRAILTHAQECMNKGKMDNLKMSDKQPIGQNTPQYMQYEQLQYQVDSDTESIPYMPTPQQQPHFNENTQAGYVSGATAANLPFEPTSLSIDSKLASYKTPGLSSRPYARKFF